MRHCLTSGLTTRLNRAQVKRANELLYPVLEFDGMPRAVELNILLGRALESADYERDRALRAERRLRDRTGEPR